MSGDGSWWGHLFSRAGFPNPEGQQLKIQKLALFKNHHNLTAASALLLHTVSDPTAIMPADFGEMSEDDEVDAAAAAAAAAAKVAKRVSANAKAGMGRYPSAPSAMPSTIRAPPGMSSEDLAGPHTSCFFSSI